MEITILTPDEKIIALNVNPVITVEDLKSLMEVKTGVTLQQQQLLFNGKEMTRNSRRLRKYGVNDGDLVVMNNVSQNSFDSIEVIRTSRRSINYGVNDRDSVVMNYVSPSSGSNNNELIGTNPDGSAVNPSAFREHILKDGHRLKELSENDPVLVKILCDYEKAELKLQLFLRIRRCQRAELYRRDKLKVLELPYADQSDPKVRRKFEAAVVPHYDIFESWEDNLEDIPDCLKSQESPYMEIEVNGSPLQVLVDTGAMDSLMTEECAKKCNLSEYINKKRTKRTIGTGGVQSSIGRINIAPIKIGNFYCLASFDVYKTFPRPCVFGMDMLRKHKCILDTEANILKFPGWIDVHVVPWKDSQKDSAPRLKDSNVPSSRYSSGNSQKHEPKGKVTRLVELGFAKKASINALKYAEGNEELAAEFLFSCFAPEIPSV